MVILTIQLLGWCWPGGIPFHYTLSVVSVPRVFGSGPFPPPTRGYEQSCSHLKSDQVTCSTTLIQDLKSNHQIW